MKHILLLVFLTIVALLATLYFRLGGNKPVEVSDTELGPYKVVSKRHVGAYHKIVPVIEEVEAWAKKNGESCVLSFGEYIDDVEKVVEDRLQSNGGCIVEKDWASGLPEGYEFRTLPRRQYVTAEFEGAPSIGPLKVYPRAKDHIKEKGLLPDGPVIEIYQILPEQKVHTRYLFPVKSKATP